MKILNTYFVLVLLPIMMLNFMVSKPKNVIDQWGLLYQFDNHIRTIRYPQEYIRIYKSEKFNREKQIVYINFSLYDNGPIGYSLSCRLYKNMHTLCQLMVFSISFGGGSYSEFEYQWMEGRR